MDVENRAGHLLLKLGVNPKLSGYYYLKDGIVVSYDDPGKAALITKILYPELARRHHTDIYRIERNIRYAIKDITQNKYTIKVLGYSNRGWTNKEVICGICEYLHMN